jgi:hypothetical protein
MILQDVTAEKFNNDLLIIFVITLSILLLMISLGPPYKALAQHTLANANRLIDKGNYFYNQGSYLQAL